MSARKLFPNRFRLLRHYILTFILLSTLVRISFLIWSFKEVDISFFKLGNTFIYGFLYDIGTVSFFTIPYILYLLLIPKKIYGSIFDKVVTYFAYTLGLIIFLFSFFAEFTFWEEFKRRFNFIAVDYLVYTNEVVQNINESYPIPILVGIILLFAIVLLFITKKKGIFKDTFTADTRFKQKLFPSISFILIAVYFGVFVSNSNAEFSKNRYNNEIAKTGIYSFFAAFRNNELAYPEFYKTIDEKTAFKTIKDKFIGAGDSLINRNENAIYRLIKAKDTNVAIRPNVIFICVESLSSKYMDYFGRGEHITPVLDSLANKSIFFTNLFATGTRTIRGMEAITLSIPPTPGRSIVKRTDNLNLFTIGQVFKEQGYTRNFFYGGDGYFDNMNTYFGGNNFDIIDRGRGFLLDESVNAKRTNIEDDEVTFENAWGVADADIYNKVLREADKAAETGKPFFDFIMTTSNHRPFTYPEGKIDIPSGTDRGGAVKYTDFAIGEFLEKAKKKSWYKNTVFVIMADHCASSAGRHELDVKNYRIPAFIINMPYIPSQKVDKLASQIDVFPTLFSMFRWEYNSNLFGMDIFSMKPNQERALIGNYRKLGLLKDNKLMVLNEQKEANFYNWNPSNNELESLPVDASFLEETISYYQVADYLFTHKGLKLKTLEFEN